MKYNFRTYLFALLAIFGLVMLLTKSEIQAYLHEYLPNYKATTYGLFYTFSSIVILLLGSTRLVFDYLQGRYSRTKTDNTELNDKISSIEETISRLKNFDDSQNETKALVEEKVNNLTTDILLKKIEDNYGESIIEKTKVDAIAKELNEIKARLETETKRISRNSNLNLSLGFATTIIAISYLSYSLLSIDSKGDLAQKTLTAIDDSRQSFYLYLIKFLPRLSVSVFIELFSFFFLRIYKRNLEDIKYLNNERTNIELKLLALNTAVTVKDSDTLKAILLDLVKTERNFILKKDESTVELEKIKSESNIYKDTLENVTKILKKN